jgi:acyl carrier protein
LTDASSGAEIESVISDYIRRELSKEPRLVTLERDTPLLESGIIDSLSLLKLVLFLEKQFGIAVKGQELVPENFATVDAICGFVKSKMAT